MDIRFICFFGGNIGFVHEKLQDRIDLNVGFYRACVLLQYLDIMGSN